jgi:hypothetical protein
MRTLILTGKFLSLRTRITAVTRRGITLENERDGKFLSLRTRITAVTRRGITLENEREDG